MDPNTPNVGLRNAKSTTNIFVQYFICRVPKKETTKLIYSKRFGVCIKG